MVRTKNKGKSLTFKILLGMGTGLVTGLVLSYLGNSGWINSYLVSGVLDVGGKIFISSLKLLVVPLVFVSLVCGTASLEDVKKIGRIGGKTLAFYLGTTAGAIAVALLIGFIINPGAGFVIDSKVKYEASAIPPLSQTLINIVPSNPIKAMAEGEMLQIIFFALLFGLALVMTGKRSERITTLFNDLNEVIMKMVLMLMALAPYGVFCLMAKIFAEQGIAVILPLGRYFLAVLAALFIHAFLFYPILLKVFSNLNPIVFLKKFKEVAVFAFTTASSNATLPVTLENVEHKLGVKNSIASFTIPLGATINMNGTAIMQGLATMFIAQVYGLDIGVVGYLTVILMGTLAAIGTAGVPGVGLITLAMILKQVNLPVEGIALIIGVDRLLDMTRTVVNVMGDSVVTCIVARSEKQLDESVYYDENAEKKH